MTEKDAAIMALTRRLLDSTDARVWAKEWLGVIAKYPDVPYDEGTMIGWFANAIETGRQAANR